VGCSCYAPGVKRVSVAIVGAGRLGTALAESLASAGYNISELITRGNARSLNSVKQLAGRVDARLAALREPVFTADLVWFCVPDSEISSVAASFLIHNWRGKIAVHSSGVLGGDVLAALRRKGARVASAHPLMTFVRGSVPRLQGVPFAIEGDRPALNVIRRVVHDLGGVSVPINKLDKIAYHAFATMVCPLLVSLLAAAEATAALARISASEARGRMMPILRQTLANYEKLGPAGAFSGPIVRGDVETVRKHLRALADAPAAQAAYERLAEAALEYLPSRNTEEMREMLREVNPGKTRRNARRTDPASKRSVRRRRKSR
jgi:predicted short-subunit dehydrogenase-like oxidoreductase (DUF2520 family)